ncbi:MAG: lipid-A-disaccharide synthase, partial [Pseudomonadota bacterium]
EYVQTKFKPDELAEKALGLLANPAMLQAQIDAQNKALSRMGERDEAAAEIAAKTILDVINAR